MPKSKEFVSSSEDESGSDCEPKKKKTKTEKEKKPEPAKEGKKKESAFTKGPEGEKMFQLSRMRFATVSEFRGKTMVSIREYYDKDGELRPGKKGITLSLEQWNALKDNIEAIDEVVKRM